MRIDKTICNKIIMTLFGLLNIIIYRLYNNMECVICYDPVSEYLKFVCKHPICFVCWNELMKINNTCPMCRQQLIVVKRKSNEQLHNELSDSIPFNIVALPRYHPGYS